MVVNLQTSNTSVLRFFFSIVGSTIYKIFAALKTAPIRFYNIKYKSYLSKTKLIKLNFISLWYLYFLNWLVY